AAWPERVGDPCAAQVAFAKAGNASQGLWPAKIAPAHRLKTATAERESGENAYGSPLRGIIFPASPVAEALSLPVLLRRILPIPEFLRGRHTPNASQHRPARFHPRYTAT